MRDQSHKHEMADALRGDFARLRARGVATTLDPVLTSPPVSVEPRVEPAGAVGPAASAEAVAPAEPAAVVDERPAGPEQQPAPSAGWLSRLRARR